MAADRHLEFSKFGILVMYPVLVILLYPTKFRVNRIIIHRDNYGQKTIFNMAAVRHFKFAKF